MSTRLFVLCSLLCAAVLLASAQPASAQAPVAQLQIYALQRAGSAVHVLLRATSNANGRDVTGLSGRDFVLLEDGVPVPGVVELTELRADATSLTRTVELPALPGGGMVAGSRPAALNVVGASIALVFDASTLTNAKGDPTDYVAQGRALLEAFIEAGRPIGSEALSLFVPLTQGVTGEALQPAGLEQFVQDRNLVLNAVNQQAARSGRTTLLDTIGLAVKSAAADAVQRGSQAYVLVVSDGGDTASAGSFDALLREAGERNVRLLILGVGPEHTLAANEQRLRTLAASSGGSYLGRPTPEQVREFYQHSVAVMPQSAYLLRYSSALLDDGQQHTLTVRLAGPQPAESEALLLPPANPPSSAALAPLALGAALRGYALRALALAVLLALALTALLVAARRVGGGGRSALSGGITRR